MDVPPILTPGPARLRAAYEAEGFHVWLVGGAVRALLLGETPADIDLCTDANPQEQTAICELHRLHYIRTGLRHGTITVVWTGSPSRSPRCAPRRTMTAGTPRSTHP